MNAAQLGLLSLLVVSLSVTACNERTTQPPLPEPGAGTRTDSSQLVRLATLPLGSELTGLFANSQGDLFFNVQHPSRDNPPPFNRAAIGVVDKLNIHSLRHQIESVSLPESDKDRRRVRVAVGNYRVLANGGDVIANSAPLGLMYSTEGKALTDGSRPDFNAFIPTPKDSNQGILFTAWESKPGTMTRLSLRKDSENLWQATAADAIDFRPVQGTWTNCFGTLSPWNTPLASEELYFDNTANWRNLAYKYLAGVKDMQSYLGFYPNPYRYGYIVEVADPLSVKPQPIKHFALGRFSHENAVVMPDLKTVYLSDDGEATVFFKFIAETPGDLTRGSLYAAKLTQDRNKEGLLKKNPATTGFNLKWIFLARGNSKEIEQWISDYDNTDAYLSDKEIAAWSQGKSQDNRAAFLESRKAARTKGASAEFRKLEGININFEETQNAIHPFLYLAISNIDKTMADDEGDIQLHENPCGGIYRFKLSSDYDVSRMEPFLIGGPYRDNASTYRCDADNIANPDNLQVLSAGRLLVGEDSSTKNHPNNMLWLYSPTQ